MPDKSMTLREISLIPGQDRSEEAAFGLEEMTAAGLDSMTLSRALSARLAPFAAMIREGCGIAVVVRSEDDVAVIGVSIGGEGKAP